MAVIPGLGTWRAVSSLYNDAGFQATINNYAYVIVPYPIPSGANAISGKTLVYTTGNQIFNSANYNWTGYADTYAGVSDSWKLHKSGVVGLTSAGNELINPNSAAAQTAFVNSVKSKLQTNALDGIFIDTFINDVSGGGNLGGVYPYDEIATQAAYEAAQVAWITAVGPQLIQLGYYVMVNGKGFIPGDVRWNSGAGLEYWVGKYAKQTNGTLNVSGVLHEYFLQDSSNKDFLFSTGPAWNQNWDSYTGEIDYCQSLGVDFHGFVRGDAIDLQKARYDRGSFLLYWNKTTNPNGAFCWTPDSGDNWNTVVALDVGNPLAAQVTLSNGIHKRRYSNTTLYVNPTPGSLAIPADDGTANVGTVIAATDALYAGASGDTQAPSVPTNVAVGSPTSSTLTVTWSASTDDTAVTGYNIRQNGSSTIRGTVDGATLTFTDTGLTSGLSYSYTVSAFDAAGNESAESSSASGTTSSAAGSTFGVTSIGDTTFLPASGDLYLWKSGLLSSGTASKLTAYLEGPAAGTYVFPADAVLDNFNRAGPALGASWQNISNLEISASTFCHVTAGQTSGSAIYATAHGPDVEAYYTLRTLPTAANDGFSLYLRHQVSVLTYYRAAVAVLANGTMSLSIYRNVSGGGETRIAGPTTVTFAANDLFGFSALGTQLTAWKKSGGTVTSLSSITDSVGPQVAGKTKIFFNSAVTIDDFGGGTVTLIGGSSQVFRPVIYDTYGPPQSAVLDNFNRAGPGLGANWTSSNMAIVGSTQLQPSSAASASAYWNVANFGPDVEMYATLVALPAVGETINFQVRHQITTLTFIQVSFALIAGPTQVLTIYKEIAGTITQVAQTTSVGITAGDKLIVSAIGTKVTVWRVTGAAAPVSILTATITDGELQVAGKSRIATTSASVIFDDFGTATVTEKPGLLKRTGSEVTVAVGTPASWIDFALSSSVALDPGNYFLGLWAGGTASQVKVYYTTSALSNGDNTNVAYSAVSDPSSPYGTSTPGTKALSVYATYTIPSVGTLGSQAGSVAWPTGGTLGDQDSSTPYGNTGFLLGNAPSTINYPPGA